MHISDLLFSYKQMVFQAIKAPVLRRILMRIFAVLPGSVLRMSSRDGMGAQNGPIDGPSMGHGKKVGEPSMGHRWTIDGNAMVHRWFIDGQPWDPNSVWHYSSIQYSILDL